MYRGEIVKPLRRQLKIMARIRHNEIYCAETRGGGLKKAASDSKLAWDMIASCRRSNKANIGSNCAVSRQSYHWLMTNHALVKKKIIADTDGAADCSCSDLEAQWHAMGMRSCSSSPTTRKRLSRMREDMVETVGIPTNIQTNSHHGQSRTG